MAFDKRNLGELDVERVSPQPQRSGSFLNKASFGDLFCETNKCLPEDFRVKVFWLCLYPQAIPLARLIWHLNRAYFQPEVELIERVRNLTNSAEVRLELNRFRYCHRSTGFFRGFLKVRISGQRLLNLADGLFGKAG